MLGEGSGWIHWWGCSTSICSSLSSERGLEEGEGSVLCGQPSQGVNGVTGCLLEPGNHLSAVNLGQRGTKVSQTLELAPQPDLANPPERKSAQDVGLQSRETSFKFPHRPGGVNSVRAEGSIPTLLSGIRAGKRLQSLQDEKEIKLQRTKPQYPRCRLIHSVKPI